VDLATIAGMTPQTDVGPILQAAFSFWSSTVLITAVEFEPFTRLGERRLTAAELGRELELHPRGAASAAIAYK
jgi:hypothetical protein